jgi:hypothetical protein
MENRIEYQWVPKKAHINRNRKFIKGIKQLFWKKFLKKITNIYEIFCFIFLKLISCKKYKQIQLYIFFKRMKNLPHYFL